MKIAICYLLAANGLGYRQLAECGTRICRLSIGLLVTLIIFLIKVPLIGDEPMLATVTLPTNYS